MDEDHSKSGSNEELGGSSHRRKRGKVTHDTQGKGHDSSSSSDATPLEYTANIAAACNAVNAESKRSRSPSEVQRLEKRRESNRLSARRCRRRRREEMDELSEELKRQSSINEALALEQKVLKEELEMEIQSLQQGNRQPAGVLPSKVAALPSQVSLQPRMVGSQEHSLQALLGNLIQTPHFPPPVVPLPDVRDGANIFASYMQGVPAATASPAVNPLSQHDALAAASLLIGAHHAPAMANNYQMMSAATQAPPPSALFSNPLLNQNLNNSDFSARLARLEAAISPVPNQTISTDLLRILLGGQTGAPMPPPFMDQYKQT